MALVQREIQETTVANGNAVETTQRINDPVAADDHRKDVAARVVWFITGVLLSLLALRFLFALLGANPANGFANFIYTVTTPFVAPFFGLFRYDFTAGVSRFETFTLVAMAIYALIGYAIAKALTLTRR
ncbi:MAG TPA: hypothetical protein VK983_01520 [Candidatus Limnocylindrales bacterium]|nr:hypothetical protein [Candidatus Limnocylindrales bacterium]